MAMRNHVGHRAALAWFETLGDGDSACFCRPTQQGFLRLTTNATIFGSLAVSNEVAWRRYQELRQDVRVEWIDEPSGLEELWGRFARKSTRSPQLWMDAYLAAMAHLHGMRLVSFDHGFRKFDGLDWIELEMPK
jgi:toxin-antitoxin system PIN domain toxin